jgi:hypothetical protein
VRPWIHSPAPTNNQINKNSGLNNRKAGTGQTPGFSDELNTPISIKEGESHANYRQEHPSKNSSNTKALPGKALCLQSSRKDRAAGQTARPMYSRELLLPSLLGVDCEKEDKAHQGHCSSSLMLSWCGGATRGRLGRWIGPSELGLVSQAEPMGKAEIR